MSGIWHPTITEKLTSLGGQFGEEQLTTIRSFSMFSKDQLPTSDSKDQHHTLNTKRSIKWSKYEKKKANVTHLKSDLWPFLYLYPPLTDPTEEATRAETIAVVICVSTVTREGREDSVLCGSAEEKRRWYGDCQLTSTGGITESCRCR